MNTEKVTMTWYDSEGNQIHETHPTINIVGVFDNHTAEAAAVEIKRNNTKEKEA